MPLKRCCSQNIVLITSIIRLYLDVKPPDDRLFQGRLFNVTNDTLNNYDPTWSPDDTQVAFVSERTGSQEIFIINRDGTGLIQLTHSGAYEPHWSSENNKIVFCSNRDGNPEIYVMNSDGSDQTRLTNNTFNDKEPAWSPNGTHIAFSSIESPKGEIGTSRISDSFSFSGDHR